MGSTIYHIGVKRRSGRYPWGSGGNSISAKADRLKNEGFSEKEIAKALGLTIRELRNQKSLEKAEIKEAQRLHVIREKERGNSVAAISRDTGIPPATIRDLLKPNANLKYRVVKAIAEVLKKAIAKFKYIDIGDGTAAFMGVSTTKFDNAVSLLKREGYTVHYLSTEQLGTKGKQLSLKVLAAPGTDWKEVNQNKHLIKIPTESIKEPGLDIVNLSPPIKNISSNRVKVIAGEEGAQKDGVLLVRPGVDDLSLGKNNYAQVRVGVDGTHYLKGMAVVGKPEDFKGVDENVDVLYYSSKPMTKDQKDLMKPQKIGEENPFGASYKVIEVPGKDGKPIQSAMNILSEEGDWSTWSKNLSSQFLSKQRLPLIKEQLNIKAEQRQAEFDEIMSLTNPTIKGHLLKSFADTLDSDAVYLKAAALPRQSTAVLLPDPNLKPNEIYAPKYRNGEMVSLVRHPHGGIFEIPILQVNNKRKSIIGPDAKDAVAVHPDVAKQLSGADFDGDTVLVLPNKGNIKTSKPLKELQSFDPRTAYPPLEGVSPISPRYKHTEMGNVSNLITDMTIKGAPDADIARAVKYSMVVIDSEKHKLNYRQAKRDLGINALKTKYQQGPTSGATTLVSLAKSQQWVPHRKDVYSIDPDTGEKIWTYTGESYIDKSTGKEVFRRTKSTKMYEEKDARNLSSGTLVEKVYADHANRLKRLGDQARLAYINTGKLTYDPNAKRVYQKEVDSLNAKLDVAIKHRPVQRKIQLLANHIVTEKRRLNPGMSRDKLKDEKSKALVAATKALGGGKPLIDITPKEWHAIEMGAVSDTKLKNILRSASLDQVKSYATPRQTRGLNPAKQSRARTLLDMGYTSSEVASVIGATPEQVLALKED